MSSRKSPTAQRAASLYQSQPDRHPACPGQPRQHGARPPGDARDGDERNRQSRQLPAMSPSPPRPARRRHTAMPRRTACLSASRPTTIRPSPLPPLSSTAAMAATRRAKSPAPCCKPISTSKTPAKRPPGAIKTYALRISPLRHPQQPGAGPGQRSGSPTIPARSGSGSALSRSASGRHRRHAQPASDLSAGLGRPGPAAGALGRV